MYFLNSDFSKLSNVDMTDQLYTTDKRSIPFLGIGTLLYTDKLYVGFSIPRLFSFENVSPQTSINKPHYFLYGGYKVVINEDIDLRPAVLGKYVVAAPFEMDMAMDAWYKNVFGIGVSYRTSDAVSFAIKARYMQFDIGYAYDMTVSGLRNFNSGTHEIYLGFSLGKKGIPERNQNNRYF
jgi:type IX secretion system PorP/SprF family membrane protein